MPGVVGCYGADLLPDVVGGHGRERLDLLGRDQDAAVGVALKVLVPAEPAPAAPQRRVQLDPAPLRP